MIYHFKNLDWILIAAVAVLCFIGLLQIYSLSLLASPSQGGPSNNFTLFKKQLVFILAGFFLMFCFSFLDYRLFKNHSLFLIFLYLISLVLLILVLFVGRPIRGSVSWFSFGQFVFQPVEFVKLVIVLVLAKYFSQRHVEMYRIQHIIVSGIYVFLPIGLVLLQPDLGSAFILIFLWMGLIILAGIKPRHLLIVLLIGLIICSAAWQFFLKDYQKQRILTFLNPQEDPLGRSYALNQSLIAIGSGKTFGKGLGHGTQAQLGFLPENKSDFIFAAFAEEWGLLGVLLLFSFWLLLFWRLTKVCLSASNNFSRIFVAGVCLIFFSQIIINLGMNMGLLPVTGISLPFISYGGSNLIMNFAELGIVQSIIRRI